MSLAIPPPRATGTTTSTPVPLYWATYGPEGAPRLLVLHGGPGAHHDYLLPQMLELASDFDLLFYDQRGGGRSKTRDPTPVTWRTHVEDLGLVVHELGAEPLTLLGYSWGALLAMLYLIEQTRHDVLPPVARLVLIDPAPISLHFRERFESEFTRRQQGEAVQRLRTELGTSGLRESAPDEYRQRTFELSVAGYFAKPERAHDLTPFRVQGRVQQSVWESLGDFDLSADLASVHVPTLVIHGREDPIPLESSEAAARALGARLVIIEDSGHVPYVEQPAVLFSAVRSFLRAAPTAVRR